MNCFVLLIYIKWNKNILNFNSFWKYIIFIIIIPSFFISYLFQIINIELWKQISIHIIGSKKIN